jgi:hypothetical protein
VLDAPLSVKVKIAASVRSAAEPSAARPTACDSALTVPSAVDSTSPFFDGSDLAVIEAFKPCAVAVAAAVSSPALVSLSWPPPRSAPVARTSAVDVVFAVADPSIVRPRPAAPLCAVAVADALPVLVTSSLPPPRATVLL